MTTTLIIEYRDHKGGDWKESAENWTVADLMFFNHICGYEKYRTRAVS